MTPPETKPSTKPSTGGSAVVGVGLLAIGVAGVSTAALWVRLSDSSALELAFRRLALALPVVFLWSRALGGRSAATARRGAGTKKRTFVLALVAGALLAAHFWAWTASLERLPAATSLILVSTHPVLVFVVECLRTGLAGRLVPLLGVAFALAGTSWLAQSDSALSGDRTVGISLALLGAVTMAGYLLVGRWLRHELPTSKYLLSVYGMAALVLGLVVTFDPAPGGGQWLPSTGREWGLALLLAMVATLLGHSAMNAALRHLPATVVSTSFLGEVVGASVLVWLICDESLPKGFVWGGGLIVIGIVLTGRGVTQSSPSR